MKITIVTGFFLPVPPLRGGSTEKIWFRLAQEFVAAGHEVTFVSRQWPGLPDRETSDGIHHIRVRGAEHARSLARNLWQDFWWGTRVARVLPPADIVICNTVTLPAWLRRRRPEAGRVVAVVARMPKGHGRAYGGADLLLSLGDAVSERLRQENSRLAGRIAPFPYPIDWQLHARAAGERQPAAGRRLTIGYVGRIHPEKGLDLLLGAATLLTRQDDLPDWRLELVGPWTIPEGGAGEEYRAQLIARHGAALGDRLAFTGPEFDPARLAGRYAAMDLFCYPSVAGQGETFGVAVAEAMAAACAPVVSGLACFRQLVRPGETGLVFDHTGENPEASLAAELARLLRDEALRREMAGRAQAHARAFDFPASARSVLATLERATRLPG